MNTTTTTNPQEERHKQAIALLRVSTDAQDVARQRTDVKKVQSKFDINVNSATELHGVSGTATLNHTQVQQILTDLARPDIDGLIVSSLDRLFRPKRYGHFAILDTFVDTGKVIWSAKEGFVDPSTDEGFDLCVYAGGKAGAEWRELIRRSRDGKMDNAKTGGINTGPQGMPYGFRHEFANKRTGDRAHMIVCEPEAEIIRRIFQWALSGMACYKIAALLNHEGIPSPRAGQKHSRTGELCTGRWSRMPVRNLLRNPAYIGRFRYKGIEIPCPVIVDPGVFAAVQMQLTQNKLRRGGAKQKYLLRGLVFCRFCGKRLYSHSMSRKRAIYHCSNVDTRPPVKRICPAAAILKELLDPAVFEAVWNAITVPATLRGLVEMYFESLPPEPSRRDNLVAEVNRMKLLEARLRESVDDPAVDRKQAREKWLATKQQRILTEVELEQAGIVREMPKAHILQSLCNELLAHKPQGFDEQRGFIERFVSQVAYGDHEAVIQCRLPLDLNRENSGSDLCIHSINRMDKGALPISFILKAKVA